MALPRDLSPTINGAGEADFFHWFALPWVYNFRGIGEDLVVNKGAQGYKEKSGDFMHGKTPLN
jgi:hypothetical protein